MTAFLRFIRCAKIAALIAGIWTISYVFLIVAWQIVIFLSGGDWPAVPVKFVLNRLKYGRGIIYETASTRGIGGSHLETASNALLQLPAIVPLLFAAVLLAIFYLWLSHTEKQYSEH